MCSVRPASALQFPIAVMLVKFPASIATFIKIKLDAHPAQSFFKLEIVVGQVNGIVDCQHDFSAFVETEAAAVPEVGGTGDDVVEDKGFYVGIRVGETLDAAQDVEVGGSGRSQHENKRSA